MVAMTCKNCSSCMKFKPAKSQETEVTNPELIKPPPMEMICLDNFSMHGWHHLICVDRFSAYIQVHSLGRETTDNLREVIKALEKMFAQYILMVCHAKFSHAEDHP